MPFSSFRYLDIYWSEKGKDKKEKLTKLRKLKKNQLAFLDRNLKIRSYKTHSFTKPLLINLIGYDGTQKYQTTLVSQAELNRIYQIIDQMPMRKAEIRQKGGDMQLYSNKNPKMTLKGTGFKNAKKAKETLKLIKDRPPVYQFQVVNTMYHRAMYHPHQTKEMRDAMKIYKTWLKKYKSKYVKT